jgi:hypothetical protein
MKFRYVGEEYSEWFGFKWMTGTEHDVTDEHAIKKLSGSVLFERVGAEKLALSDVVRTASGGTLGPAEEPKRRRKAPEQEG